MLSDPTGLPVACSVDPISGGNLAVVNASDDVGSLRRVVAVNVGTVGPDTT